MEKVNLLNKKHIHFIGICGISMSALAILVQSYGIKVTGSDHSYDVIVKKLRKLGIGVNLHHSADNISNDCDLVVYTGAVKDDNVELVRANELGIATMERSEFLGEVCKMYKHVIAIAGTHGKTTTTSMICNIFKMANLNPTMHIGGIANNFNSNVVIGDNDYFITEACEYRNSFKYIKSDTCVITSTDPDHMDCYKSINDLENAYVNFAKQSDNIVLPDSIKNINIKRNKIVVGFDKNCTYFATNLKCNKEGCFSFDVWKENMYIANFKLNVIGKFNVYNSLCAIAVCMQYNIPISTIYDGLREFSGVKRRNEQIATINNVPIICDYAHHPTEIEKTILANKKIYKNILCVFQPHTYSRTKIFMSQFISSFKGVKKLIVFKTYPAREVKIKGGDATDLYNLVKIKKENKFYASNKFELKKLIYDNMNDCNCILILGAGNIYNIVKNVIKY